MSQQTALIGIIVTLLLVLFFAGMEIAFVTANKLNIELRKKQGKSSGTILSKYNERPSSLVGTLSAGLILSFIIYALLFQELMKQSVWRPIHLENEYLVAAFNFCIALLLAVLFGRLLPRTIFSRNDKLLYFLSPIMDLFVSILSPIVKLFSALSKGILVYLFNINKNALENYFSKAKVDQFYRIGKSMNENNPTPEGNARLFENALSLAKTTVRQCLVPRTEIIAVPDTITIADLRQRFLDKNVSRLVVYKESIDNIIGYAHQLDLFKKPKELSEIILPVFIVPESMNAINLMTNFSRERKSVAWVVDEYGGTAGIVTMEDIIQEIFGDIHDTTSVNYLVEKKLSDREYIFSGRLELDYLNHEYALDFPANRNAETLSGYIINHNKTIPKLNDHIIIEDYEFEILNITDTRIDKVQMKVLR
ncbi:MAG: HlyC/CorC family transporter [Pseudopedobacter saltans]|uniref:HlyC/CorC family transporter n=1 Tax=Pseudopedobacter saltans TaxID=151895 RepID=A0A2W5F7A9_9SPHI|nr:MAG: HlyC/CorC family transporter [Pseudopedobacter saltans]